MLEITFVECPPVGGGGGFIGTLMQHVSEDAGWYACKSQKPAASRYIASSRYYAKTNFMVHRDPSFPL